MGPAGAAAARAGQDAAATARPRIGLIGCIPLRIMATANLR
jgi:hypothetical protein